MGRVSIAELRRARGNKGELAATPLSDHPERFEKLTQVFVAGRELTVERTWWHGADVIFKFAGVDSISAAELLAGNDVEIPLEERIGLDEGEYFLSDLMGCEVYDQAGLVGRITGWQELPGQILLEVGNIEFPFKMIRNVDLEAKRIEVELPEGLKDLNK